MFYAILGIIVVVALFLIFRDDHDDSYNKSEKGQQKAQQTRSAQSQYQKEAQKQEFKAGPRVEPEIEQPKAEHPKVERQKTEKKQASRTSLKDQILGEIESAISEAKKDIKEPMGMFWSAMNEAKAAVDKAMKEAGQKPYWTSSTDVDEQEQPEAEEPDDEDWEDEEEIDLSFLDNFEYYEDLEENSETFDITGLRYHCTVHDCGKIVGYVKPEPSNVHDNRAQAVIRSDGKLLGYIPRTQLDWYEDFNEQNVMCPFVGEIELDRSSARLIAEIKVIIPTSLEFVEEEIEDGV